MESERCIAFNKNNKRCRAKLKEGKLFCCEAHYPKNREIFEMGCFICCEDIKKSSDVYYFKCNHCIHKKCFDEWLNHSNYSSPICMLCRNEVFKIQEKVYKVRNIGVLNKNDYKKMENIINLIT